MKKQAKWKPSKDKDINEYNFMKIPSTNLVMFFVNNENGVRSVWCCLSTKEAKEFGNALIDAAYYNDRINGIRAQNHTMRWV